MWYPRLDVETMRPEAVTANQGKSHFSERVVVRCLPARTYLSLRYSSIITAVNVWLNSWRELIWKVLRFGTERQHATDRLQRRHILGIRVSVALSHTRPAVKFRQR